MRKIALAAVIGLAALPAMAQTLDAFVPRENGAIACWQRIYDDAHLASHPDQQVKRLTFGLTYQFLSDSAVEGVFLFGLAASLRDGHKGTTGGGCWEGDDGTVRCGVDCDGGGVAISLRADGNLRADLEAMGYIHMESECGGGDEDASFPIEAGLDDKLFLLHKADPAICQRLVPRW